MTEKIKKLKTKSLFVVIIFLNLKLLSYDFMWFNLLAWLLKRSWSRSYILEERYQLPQNLLNFKYPLIFLKRVFVNIFHSFLMNSERTNGLRSWPRIFSNMSPCWKSTMHHSPTLTSVTSSASVSFYIDNNIHHQS